MEAFVDSLLPEGYTLEQPLGSDPTKQFIADNYWIPCTLSVVYVSFVFGMQGYLKEKDAAAAEAWVREQKSKGKTGVTVKDAPTYDSREAFWVKPLLFTWNMLLGIFSMLGLFFTIRAIRFSLSKHTLSEDLCNYTAETHNPWFLLFVLSKVPELIDTVFLVCRRRPVILLHWYHHVATMLYCWDGWANDAVMGSWFAVLNLFVHSIMYTYYGLTTYKRFPQWFRLVITSLQLAQMVLGTAINVHNLVVCPLDYPRYLTFGLLMYFSYLVLFAHLFYVNYCKPRQPRPASSAAKQNAAGDAEKKGTKASGKGTAPAPAPATNKKNN